MIRIEILGEPIPAARPRFSGKRAYQPKRNVEYRKLVQSAARSAMGGQEPITGTLSAVIRLYRKFKPTSRSYGDWDNHGKAISDALNEIVYADDAQLVRVTVEKYCDKENPRAVVEISGDSS